MKTSWAVVVLAPSAWMEGERHTKERNEPPPTHHLAANAPKRACPPLPTRTSATAPLVGPRSTNAPSSRRAVSCSTWG